MLELAGVRVLVVEDDFLIAASIRESLIKLGATVIGPVPTISAALDSIDVNPNIDAALLDLNLGGVHSYPVADALTERNIRFIFSTGYSQDAIPEKYSQVPVCAKPDEPVSTLKRLLDR